MANKVYKLQNHSVIKVVKKEPKPYNLVNRNTNIVTGVMANSWVDAMEQGREYFQCNNVHIIR